MYEIFWTDKIGLEEKILSVLTERTGKKTKILRTQNGKPFTEGNPLFFSISHSGDTAGFVICDKPVGFDAEKIRERKISSVLSHFTDREKGEIAGTEDFLRHWVVREAYVKMLGATLAEKLSGLEFAGGILYDGGERAECDFVFGKRENAVYCICIDNNV